MTTEPCKLDCNYLPANFDDDGAVLDSRRSEARIPGVLSKSAPLDTSSILPEDAKEAGLAQKCTSCLAPAPRPRKGNLPLCHHCSSTRNGLTTTCDRCSTPIRPPTNDSDVKLCEKCNFGCFRCGRRAIVWHDGRVSCKYCNLVWKAGVLGYELVAPKRFSNASSPPRLRRNVAASERGLESERDDLADGEREYYASLWG